MKHKNKIILILILILATVLRFYKLGVVPPSITWDEAAVGYNAYSILNYGEDEWGKRFPLVFKSFGDDKHPIHIYLTTLSILFLGLSDFSVRLPAAVFGVVSVFLVYYLAKLITEQEEVSLFSALFMAVSPYGIQFSRFNHEAIITLTFFIAGLIFLVRYLRNYSRKLYVVAFFWGVSILTYHAAVIFIPLFCIYVLLLYHKKIFESKKAIALATLAVAFFMILYLINSDLLGLSRLSQTSISKEMIQSTSLYKGTNDMLLGRVQLYLQRYISHFSYEYLFKSGDINPKFSSQYTGQFYLIEGVFIVMGFILILYKRSKMNSLILLWAVLGPIPAAITGGASEAPHAARALFTMGSWQLLAGLGAGLALGLIKEKTAKVVVIAVILFVLGALVYRYLIYYYQDYTSKYAFEWIYGMKQSVDYIQAHPNYEKVYMTDSRSQPYIFFLYYLKYPAPKFISERRFNQEISKSYNLISSFDKFHFGDWDQIESKPVPGVLYILNSSKFDGLRHKNQFNLKKPIKNPDGTVAFYLVSLY